MSFKELKYYLYHFWKNINKTAQNFIIGFSLTFGFVGFVSILNLIFGPNLAASFLFFSVIAVLITGAVAIVRDN